MNLLLVPVGPLYRPPLPISQRTELATAFAQGQAARASGCVADEKHMHQVMEMSADERAAYRLGVAGPDALQAPTSLVVAVPRLLAEGVAEMLLTSAPRPWRHKLVLAAAYGPAVFYAERLDERARVRRARALGLTVDTAPRPVPLALLGQLLGSLPLLGIQQLLVRRRTGRWGRARASSLIAARAARLLRIRRDWHAAYKHGPQTT